MFGFNLKSLRSEEFHNSHGGKKHEHLDATENADSSSVAVTLPLIHPVFTPTQLVSKEGVTHYSLH
jgi:hypothetical protein